MINRRVSFRTLAALLTILAAMVALRALPLVSESLVFESVKGLLEASLTGVKTQIVSNEHAVPPAMFAANSITSLGVPFTEDFAGMEDSSGATLPAGFKIG